MDKTNNISNFNEKQRISYFNLEETNKFEEGIKSLKQEVSKPSQIIVEGISLVDNGSSMDLVIDNSKDISENISKSLESTLELNDIDDLKIFEEKVNQINEYISDSKVDYYIASIAEEKEFIDIAYSSIKKALSKDNNSSIYRGKFKDIYEKRKNKVFK